MIFSVFRPRIPWTLNLRVENKNFYFDIGQNNRGVYMRIRFEHFKFCRFFQSSSCSTNLEMLLEIFWQLKYSVRWRPTSARLSPSLRRVGPSESIKIFWWTPRPLRLKEWASFQVFSTKLFTRFRDIFDDYVIGMKEAAEAEEGAKDKWDFFWSIYQIFDRSCSIELKV